MKHTLLILSLACMLGYQAQAQYLSVGVRSISNMAYPVSNASNGLQLKSVSRFQYNKNLPQNAFSFYFPNSENETLHFDPSSDSEFTFKWPFMPDVFVRYTTQKDWFVQCDFYPLLFTNPINYYNSVDFTTYVDAFNPSGNGATYGYRQLQLDWSFWGTTATFGKLLLRTKSLRPYIYGGISSLYLASFKYDKEQVALGRQQRDDLIYRKLDTFNRLTLYGRLGAGIKYHLFSVDVYYEQNITKIDALNTGSSGEAYYYKSFHGMYFSVSYTIFHYYNLLKNSHRNKIENLVN